MPEIGSRDLGIALDMNGCPNRCRHCWLGCTRNKRMDESDLRWTVEQFRRYVKPGEDRPFVKNLKVFSSFREPDYPDDYSQLYELEKELSDGEPIRFELLSIWRLARDPRYAEWASALGPDTCQISFFGMEETQDWFYRRKGAFQDCLIATERLLEVGMKPRWQMFLTKKILPDLGELMRLIDRLKLRERVNALGSDFVMFMHPPGLVGEGMNLAHLSAEESDLELIPEEIVEATARHFGNTNAWISEREYIARLNETDEGLTTPFKPVQPLVFFVLSNWDVYSNQGTLQPWWKLGNMKIDTVENIIGNYENNLPPGMQTNLALSARDLARRYGNPDSRMIVNDVQCYWLEKHCKQKDIQ